MRNLATFVFVLSVPVLAKTYSVDGIVVAVDRPARTMLVSHRAIAHYMPAMLMPFRDDAVPPSSAEQLAIGSFLPEFQLTDQHGRTFGAGDLRGKVAAIDFIYTRCPLPDVCPRLSANFAMLQRHFHDLAGDNLLLISVTVDPDYDTAGVLADYARRWAAGEGWRFLTGDVAPLAAALGEIYWAEEGSIGHNSTTSIIGRDGRLAARVEGSNYRPDQLVHLIARQLETHL